MKAVLYIRVSTEDQTIGLDAQLAKLKAWSELNDAEVVGEYRDAGISGTREDRPGLAAALDTACKHKAAIVVYSLSRLSRSTSHCITLAAFGYSRPVVSKNSHDTPLSCPTAIV